MLKKVGYCTNVHAGATFEAMLSNLRTHALEVKRQVSPGATMGVGLWLSAAAAHEAIERGRVRELGAFLDENGLDAFTFNGFPYGDFHQAAVKHRVYEPDWTQRARFEYTLDLASILSQLGQGEAGISTLPIAWGRPGESRMKAAAAQVAAVAERLAQLEQRTGRLIHLDLEPEPGCALDTSVDVVNFFEHHLIPAAPGREASLRRHVRVCHDVCHAAVMWEDQGAVLSRYERSGILVGKVQVSSAIHVPFDRMTPSERTGALAQLRQFAEDRYLHQTTAGAADGGGAGVEAFYEDLHEAIQSQAMDRPWRVHFHVPIDLERFGLLETTRAEVLELLDLGPRCAHFEVETYAWGVLPVQMRPAKLSEGIAREMKWFLEARR